ncbi:MAG: hypothetical protein KIG68_00630 [Oxalobacter sp.]|nr:hypothetical protein [Oxalobacter sp.]
MIVEEQVGSFVNVYVGGMVFTADGNQHGWQFGDGDDSPERWASLAKQKGMTVDDCRRHYQGICNAAAGWLDDVWTFRYEVVCQEGTTNVMLQEMMDSVTEAIDRNKASQDREQCQQLLRRTLSLGVVRMYGLGIRKYIFPVGKAEKKTIAYQREELTPYHFECLVPEKVRQSVVHQYQEVGR